MILFQFLSTDIRPFFNRLYRYLIYVLPINSFLKDFRVNLIISSQLVPLLKQNLIQIRFSGLPIIFSYARIRQTRNYSVNKYKLRAHQCFPSLTLVYRERSIERSSLQIWRQARYFSDRVRIIDLMCIFDFSASMNSLCSSPEVLTFFKSLFLLRWIWSFSFPSRNIYIFIVIQFSAYVYFSSLA